MFNFDKPVDRANTHSYKYDGMRAQYNKPDLITLGCADCEIECCPAITEAIQKRAQHPVFGYTIFYDELYDSISKYYKRHHDMTIQKEDVIFMPGLLTGATIVMQTVMRTNPGKVALLVPEYPCFLNLCKANKFDTLYINLHKQQDNTYIIDWNEFESTIKQCKVFLFSNPHNPTGNVFSREDVQKIGDICSKYNCYIISDEIWCDVILDKQLKHTSMLSICDQNSVTLIAGSKSYNIAGLGLGMCVVKDQQLKQQIKQFLEEVHLGGGSNPFAIAALEAAMTSCDQWIQEFNEYILQNCLFIKQFFEQHMPLIKVNIPQGTTLMWVDFSGVFETAEKAFEFCLDANVYLAPGQDFSLQKDSMMRLNAASYRGLLEEALNRLKKKYDQIVK